jgi:hypothetical protein
MFLVSQTSLTRQVGVNLTTAMIPKNRNASTMRKRMKRKGGISGAFVE